MILPSLVPTGSLVMVRFVDMYGDTSWNHPRAMSPTPCEIVGWLVDHVPGSHITLAACRALDRHEDEPYSSMDAIPLGCLTSITVVSPPDPVSPARENA